eukprot:tig00000342_g24193.t1
MAGRVDLALLAARRIPAPLRMQSLSGIGAPQRVHARIGAPLGRRSFAGGSGGIPTPVDAVEAFIRAGHEVVGLPWWLAIAGSALAVRLAFLPLVLYSRRVSARYSSLKPHRQLAFALATSSAKEKREQYLDYVRAVWIQCSLFDSNPLKALVAPLAMIPVFISFAWAMRRMAIPGSGMELGGILWFEDLTLPDVHFPGIMSLAIINCAIVLANLVVSFRTTDRSLLYVKDICMVLVVAMTCFTAQLPQGFFMYWIPSSLFALVTTLLTRHPLMQERLLRTNRTCCKGFGRRWSPYTLGATKTEGTRAVRGAPLKGGS